MMNEDLDDPEQAITFSDLENEIQVDLVASASVSPMTRQRKKKSKKTERKKRASIATTPSGGEVDRVHQKAKKVATDEIPKRKKKKKAKDDMAPLSEPRMRKKKKGSRRTSEPSHLDIETSGETKRKSRRSKSPTTPKRTLHPKSNQLSLIRQQSVTGKALGTEKIQKAQLAVRQRIIQELYDTEKRYVEGLQCLCSKFLLPLQETNLIAHQDFSAIFSNIDTLLAYHHGVLAILKKIVDGYCNTSPVADVFLQSIGFIGEYAAYLSNYSSGIVTLYYMKQRNEQFCTLLLDWENMPEVTLPIASYLVMPVQRLPRYILLFKDMKKYTPETHPDTPSLPKVVDFLQTTLDNINKGIDKELADQNSKLLSIIESIDGAEMVVVPKRKFIKEGKVRIKQKGLLKNILKRKSHVFLFNDILVVCEAYDQPKGVKQYECKIQISLANLKKEDVTVSDDGITVRCEDTFTLKTVNELDDVAGWVSAFELITQ